jgi:hypothetical protein
MVLSRRTAALSAVRLIPMGIAATGYALADSPKAPEVPSQQVELDHGSPIPTSTLDPSPTATPPGATPGAWERARPARSARAPARCRAWTSATASCPPRWSRPRPCWRAGELLTDTTERALRMIVLGSRLPAQAEVSGTQRPSSVR